MEKKPYGMQRNTPVSGVRKNRPIKNSLFLIAALLLISLTSLHADDVANLRCEYLENPLGIDVANSRLSWVIEERDQKPEAGSRKPEARNRRPIRCWWLRLRSCLLKTKVSSCRTLP
jgi:hypothetical protein